MNETIELTLNDVSKIMKKHFNLETEPIINTFGGLLNAWKMELSYFKRKEIQLTTKEGMK